MNQTERWSVRERKMMNRTYLFEEKRFKTEDKEKNLQKTKSTQFSSLFSSLNKRNGISHLKVNCTHDDDDDDDDDNNNKENEEEQRGRVGVVSFIKCNFVLTQK